MSCQCFKLGVIKVEVGSSNTTRAKENPIGMSDVAAEKVRTRDLNEHMQQRSRRVQVRFIRIAIFQRTIFDSHHHVSQGESEVVIILSAHVFQDVSRSSNEYVSLSNYQMHD